MSTHHFPALSGSDRTTPGVRSVNEVAVFLGISRGTVYKLVRDGQLRAVRVGERLRFRDIDLERYLERDAEPAP